MRHTRGRAAAPLLALLAALAAAPAGCVSGRPAAAGADGEAAGRPASVLVDNQSLRDHTMYLVRSGVRTRIGQVGASRSVTLRIPASLVQQGTPVRIVADPVGGGSVVSQQFTLGPGDEVPMQIPPG